MSRIEIPLSEYNGLKKKVKDLEKALNDVSNEASLYKEKLGTVESAVLDLEGEGLVNRIFSWKNTIEPLTKLLKVEPNGNK